MLVPPRHRDWRLFAALIVLIGLGFGLRAFRLGAQDLWGDEAFSAWLSQQSLGTILSDLGRGEPHPPLYPVMLWLWIKLAGNGEFALRFPSTAAGVAIVPLMAVLAGHLRDRLLAVVAGTVAAISPFLVWYSQETRMYIFVATFAAASALAYANLRDGDRSWLVFGASAALMIYSHYYGLLVLAGLALLALAAVIRQRLAVRTAALAFGLPAVLYLPWVWFASRIFFDYYGVAPGRVDLGGIFQGFWLRSSFGWAIEPAEALRWLPVFVVLALIGLLSGLVRRAEGQRRGGAMLLFAWLAAPLLGGYLVSLIRPMYAERYLIVATPAYLLLVAAGITVLMRWRPIGVLAFVLVLAAGLVPLRDQFLNHRYVKSEYSQHTEQLSDLAKETDAVILDGPSQVFLFDYYYRGNLSHYDLPRDVPVNESQTAAELADLAAKHSGLWLFLYATHDYDPADFVEQWLNTNAYRAWHSWTINGQLDYYASYSDRDLSALGGSATFGDKIAVEQVATAARDYVAGDVVPVKWRWRALANVDRDLKVALRIRDAQGFVWGQTDAEPLSGFRPTHLWRQADQVDDRLGLMILPGTPPGRYVLEMRVYPADGAALAVASEGPKVDDKALILGEVVVAKAGKTPAAVTVGSFRRIGRMATPELALEGTSGSGDAVAGQSAYLTVVWRALSRSPVDYGAKLRFIDGAGQVAGEVQAKPYNGGHGPKDWDAGQIVRWQYNVPVPPNLPAGEYRLALSLVDPVTGNAGPPIDFERLKVTPRMKPAVLGKPQVELGMKLGGSMALQGYSIDTGASAGGKLGLTLYWQPTGVVDTAYTVFAHLLDSAEHVRAQVDAQPCNGQCPTTSWVSGDVIEDRYEIPIGADVPAGEYQIEVGMYDARSGKRLPVFSADGVQAGDRVLLPKMKLGGR